jgi:hypothetical protein
MGASVTIWTLINLQKIANRFFCQFEIREREGIRNDFVGKNINRHTHFSGFNANALDHVTVVRSG